MLRFIVNKKLVVVLLVEERCQKIWTAAIDSREDTCQSETATAKGMEILSAPFFRHIVI